MIKNQLKTTALLATLTALLLFVANLLGGRFGLMVGLVLAVLMNFGTYFFAHKIVLFMYRAKPADKRRHAELYSVVKDVAQRAQIPMPQVFVIPSESPNAFATGRNPSNGVVACTEGIMRLLTRDELRGVIAHEMAHIKNRDILIQTIASTIAGVVGYVASMAQWAAIFGGGGRDDEGGGNLLGLLVLAIITPIIAMIIQLAISRSREYLADETGAKIVKDPLALASALEKLDRAIPRNPLRFGHASTSSLFIANPFSAKSMLGLLSTHPPMDERVKRLKEMKV
ncbi:zinc metalloprotease HtpX [Candidatus Woesearchaeota archaeon]|nr:zinc metalloprotease HtpX [Candidatus Woesearchaeota archaeon]